MCIVSDKIKFCTCVNGSVDELLNYWLLYRFNKKKDLFIEGEPILPLDYLQPNHKINKQTLRKRLNEPDAFDKKIEFKEKDELEIVINNLSDDDLKRMLFCFKFKKGKWVEERQDVFEIMSHYSKYKFGKLDGLGNL